MGIIFRNIVLLVAISILNWFSKRAEIPIYSFEKHAREEKTTSIYSPHVLILEGIFALYDPRVLKMLDMKVVLKFHAQKILWLKEDRSFVKLMEILACHEEVSTLTRNLTGTDLIYLVLRDVAERGRDVEGCIKQVREHPYYLSFHDQQIRFMCWRISFIYKYIQSRVEPSTSFFRKFHFQIRNWK